MVQSLQLGEAHSGNGQNSMRRLNRLPILVGLGLVLTCMGVVIFGLSWRGGLAGRNEGQEERAGAPATSFADQLKRGIGDVIIGDPEPPAVLLPAPQTETRTAGAIGGGSAAKETDTQPKPSVAEAQEDWKIRLKREQEEQYLREENRQKMARLQAQATALDSPIAIDLPNPVNEDQASARANLDAARDSGHGDYASALRAAMEGQGIDANGQAAKEEFFNQDIKELGYLPNQVVAQRSPYELKRGAVIPATLLTGLNSDLPGRISGQVSQNVYDSATGHLLLIPQGTKLFGRYDAKISFGQERVLVVWTDLIFPNGSTLQIAGMAGTDAEGYGGFKDRVDRHIWRSFGSAALVALIGTGIDMSMPESSTLATQDSASDAARRNFAESFGRVAEQTISKSLNVQPTIRIRPGYQFNVLVDQDIVFPGPYRGA